MLTVHDCIKYLLYLLISQAVERVNYISKQVFFKKLNKKEYCNGLLQFFNRYSMFQVSLRGYFLQFVYTVLCIFVQTS